MYRLFYNYKLIGDVLIVLIDNNDVDKVITKGDLVLLYSNSKLCGFNIFNFSRIVKTKASGMIINPPKIILDIINNMLKDANETELDYLTNSGFIIGEIKKCEQFNGKYRYNVDIGYNISILTASNDYALNEKVIVATKGCILANGRICDDFKIVDTYEAGLSFKHSNIEIDDNYQIGEDYFKEK